MPTGFNQQICEILGFQAASLGQDCAALGGQAFDAGLNGATRMSSLRQLVDLSGQTALITGAAAGIGRAVSELFAAEGAHVIATDPSEPAGACWAMAMVWATHTQILIQQRGVCDA